MVVAAWAFQQVGLKRPHLLLRSGPLVALRALGRDRRVLGRFANGRGGDLLALGAFGVVAVSLVGLAVAGLAR